MNRYANITYDAVHDYFLVEYKPVTISTKEEVAVFEEEVTSALRKPGRPVDVLVNLGELVVRASAVATYDQARQRMISGYARRAYRFSGSNLVRTRILTSSTLNGQTANVFSSFAEALAALLADRAEQSREKSK